jgi:hypothetical protein
MDSLSSLLIGFYTLLSYSYSQQHTMTTQGYVQPAAGTWSGIQARTAAPEREQFGFTQNSTGLAN